MNSSARVRRGFRRLGIAIAVPVLMIGAGLSFIVASEQATHSVRSAEHHNCVLERWRAGKASQPPPGYVLDANRFARFDTVEVKAEGCPWSWSVSLTPDAKPLPVPNYWSSALPGLAIGGAISLAVATLALILFMTLGWIIAGFMRDEGR